MCETKGFEKGSPTTAEENISRPDVAAFFVPGAKPNKRRDAPMENFLGRYAKMLQHQCGVAYNHMIQFFKGLGSGLHSLQKCNNAIKEFTH